MKSVSRDLFYLYLAHGTAYLLPLLTLPYLSRTLGPEGFGLLALAQSLATHLQVLGDYAFSTLATRETAAHSGYGEELRRVVWGVASAKLLLTLPLGGATWMAVSLLPPFQSHPLLGLAAFAWALGWGTMPTWFFLGTGRTREVALLEVGSRTLGTLAIFALVREPHQAYLPPLLSGGAYLLLAGLGWWKIALELGKPALKLDLGWTYLRTGWFLFLSRGLTAFYTSVNPLILSLFAPPGLVGIYAGADRLVRALLGAIDPLSRAFFPRLSHLAAGKAEEARHLAQKALLAHAALGLAMSMALYATAPLAASLLGPGYGEVAHLVRILSPVPLLVAISHFLGAQWMLALRLDRTFVLLLAVATGVHILLTPLLSWKYGPYGMAWGTVAVETFVTASMILYLRRIGMWPFGGGY